MVRRHEQLAVQVRRIADRQASVLRITMSENVLGSRLLRKFVPWVRVR